MGRQEQRASERKSKRKRKFALLLLTRATLLHAPFGDLIHWPFG